MRLKLTTLLFCACFLQNSIAQSYYVDSIATLTIFGLTGSSITTQKFQYDEQHRVIRILSEFQEIEYEYSNLYDHTITYFNASSGQTYSRLRNYYNSDGFIISEEGDSYNQQTMEFSLSSKRTYDYDEDNKILLEERFSYDYNTGTENLLNSISYFYVNDKLVTNLGKYYSGNGSLYLTRTTDYDYVNGLLDYEFQESVANSNITSYHKEYTYNNDESLDSYTTTYFNGNDSSYQYNSNFEYLEEGVYEYLEYKNLTGNSFEQLNVIYNSYIESPFYDIDTVLNSFVFEGQEFESESRFNSSHFSADGDSVLVRREARQADFEFEAFTTIAKEFHIKYSDSPTNVIENQKVVAHIFPTVTTGNATILVQKMNSEINRIEIYNSMGQKVKNVTLEAHQALIQAPNEAGMYYFAYFKNDQQMGKVGKLSVN